MQLVENAIKRNIKTVETVKIIGRPWPRALKTSLIPWKKRNMRNERSSVAVADSDVSIVVICAATYIDQNEITMTKSNAYEDTHKHTHIYS